MLKFFRSTNHHKKYWEERKIDWSKSYLIGIDEVSGRPMWDHPHRDLIVQVLKSFRWYSLIEIGCGAGANLMKIVKSFSARQIGGIDINADAIELASKTFNGGLFKVGSADKIMLSDKATDVILSDAVLIYVGPFKIGRYLKEIKRLGRHYVVFCEFHSSSFLERLLLKIKSGYYAYNWPKLLKKYGFYDIIIWKIPKEAWPGSPWEQYGYIFVARIPKK